MKQLWPEPFRLEVKKSRRYSLALFLPYPDLIS
jgi:hypothetical protein